MRKFCLRVNKLRELLLNYNIDGIIIHSTNEHCQSYPFSGSRLRWLTGFNGVTGKAIILLNKAIIFFSENYELNQAKELDLKTFEIQFTEKVNIFKWMQLNIKRGKRILYDSRLCTENEVLKYQRLFENNGIEFLDNYIVSNAISNTRNFINNDENFVDLIWKDKPKFFPTYLEKHQIKYSGKHSYEKIKNVSKGLKKEGIDLAILTLPDSIAWLLNIRGNDVPFVPIVFSYALLRSDATVDLFVGNSDEVEQIQSNFDDYIKVHSYDKFYWFLKNSLPKNVKIQIDKTSLPFSIISILKNNKLKVINKRDPCLLPRSCKNNIELSGMRKAHIRDGVALVKFFSWLSKSILTEEVTETNASEKLLAFRKEQPLFKDSSFETISAFGENSAIIHYNPTLRSNKKLVCNDIYLIDSGGHYLDGTTDVTRTISLGMPTKEQKDLFTYVLKGYIALSLAKFPFGTTGEQLDVLARRFLWEKGFDYPHGTGHGVGSYLSVHEGPQIISKIPSFVKLMPGMVISNEPGYYKKNSYGIRIESLLAVIEEDKSLKFETLTLCPIDKSLINIGMLDKEEVFWLNSYHSRVYECLNQFLDEKSKKWLFESTKALNTK